MKVLHTCFTWFFCLCFLIYFQPCTGDGCNPNPIEEGKPGTLSCSAPISTRNLTWLIEKDGQFVTVSTCNSQEGCQNFFQAFSASDQNSFNGTVYQSLLTINSASRNEALFKCVADGGYGEIVCKIEVYVIPESPVCNSPVVYSTSEVSITCSTARVYPEALCLFFYLFQSTTTPISVQVTYKNMPSSTHHGDTATNCSFIMDMSGLKPGRYQFSLSMFPKISKVPGSAIKVSASATEILLEAPSVVLAKDCPNGPSMNASYIDARYSSQTTCRCELVDEGIPPGHASWLDTRGSVVGVTNDTDGSSSLTLSYVPSDPNPTYECHPTTVLNTTAKGVIYRPIYATGPDAVTIELSDQVFNLCPSDNQSITVTCRVNANQVNPETTFSVFVDSQTHVLRQFGERTSSEYSYSYNFRPQRGGNSVITCRAENSLFFDAQTKTTTKLSVQEPPKAEPTVQIVQGMDSRGTIAVICSVDGGIPLVQSVTLQCGDKQNGAQVNRVALTMTATQNMTGLFCYCKATHVTDCYYGVSQGVLNVQMDNTGDSKVTNKELIIGLSVGFGGVAVILCLVLIIFILRRRRRRRSSKAPRASTFALEWNNNKLSYPETSQRSYPRGSAHYVSPPSYKPPEPPGSNDYDEIASVTYTTNEDLNIDHAVPRAHYNARFLGDYITPLS